MARFVKEFPDSASGGGAEDEIRQVMADYYVSADEDTGFRQLVRQATLGDAGSGDQPEEATSPPARKPQK